MRDNDCIFCKIANGEIPSKTIYEDDNFRAILDIEPATKGHTLILPKEHCENLFELPEEMAEKALVLAKKLSIRLHDKLKSDGLNIVQNNGAAAGQTVSHFHIHLIPRYEDDNQKITWIPGSSVQEELESIKEQIIS